MKNPVEDRIKELGTRFIKSAREEEGRFQAAHRIETALLDWCMANDELKTRAFRFIDVYPSLKTAAAVHQHIQEYFPRSEHRLPSSLRAGLLLTRPAILTRNALQKATHHLYLKVARLFIGAASEGEALARLEELADRNIDLSMDLLGEQTMSEVEAENYYRRYESLIQRLGDKRLGIQKQNVSVKLSALDPNISALDPEGSSERVRNRLRKLLHLALQCEVFIHIDMEDYEFRDLTLKIVRDVLKEPPFNKGIPIGIVLQAYLRDADQCLDHILEWAGDLPVPLTIRLVRGAYWDTEIMRAQDRHWPIPVFVRKEETDSMFEHLTQKILAAAPKVRLAVATHNVRSIAYAIAKAESLHVKKESLEFQLLYGMGTPLIPAIQEAGFRPRLYMPIGDPVTGMAYLVRRLLENVSSQSFVRQGIHNDPEIDKLLDRPPAIAEVSKPVKWRVATEESPGFQPAPPLAFFKENVRTEFSKAVDNVSTHFGIKIPLVINGKRLTMRSSIPSLAAADGETLIAEASEAGKEEALEAVAAAQQALGVWSGLPVEDRAERLQRAAYWMLDRRYELAATAVHEAGKPWRDADAEITEAIDYLAFYADAARRIMQPKSTEQLSHETNVLKPKARGVTVVIAPWNFPFAILTGMSAAALAAGNTVVLKPAEQSSLCAWRVFEAYEAAGIPPGVINFVSGYGEEVGPVLVRHKNTAMIAFTGSKKTGLEIASNAQFSGTSDFQIKKVILELGGKNAAIVDETADFDQAVPAVLESAFGYAGQKCSALSRLIVLDAVYDTFVKRLREAAKSFVVGDNREARTLCGPVIDREALEKIQRFIEVGKKDGKVLFEAAFSTEGSGYFVNPVIFTDLPETSDLWRDEIFGPVLVVQRAVNFEEALRLANDTEFALTGGLFSRTPSHIRRVKTDLAVGNLYINRRMTGALVGRQPFGGFKMSGAGSKSGSVDYLREFFIQQTVSENISRHGFAPLLDL